MNARNLPLQILSAVIEPGVELQKFRDTDINPASVFLGCSIWLLLLPPLVFYFGASNFGWLLGGSEPLYLSKSALMLTAGFYFIALVFGFFSTVIISRWMAVTYGASVSWGLHFTLITIVGAPLAIVSMGQWYPDVFLNLLILIPAIIWSIVLLYKGVPIVLGITPEKGMLMASSLVGWLLVAAVSLLGITMGLWTVGFGPFIGV